MNPYTRKFYIAHAMTRDNLRSNSSTCLESHQSQPEFLTGIRDKGRSSWHKSCANKQLCAEEERPLWKHSVYKNRWYFSNWDDAK